MRRIGLERVLPRVDVALRPRWPAFKANPPRSLPSPSFSYCLEFSPTNTGHGLAAKGHATGQRSAVCTLPEGFIRGRRTIIQYFCNNDGFNLGLRIAWSVRAGRPAYSVSRAGGGRISRAGEGRAAKRRLFGCFCVNFSGFYACSSVVRPDKLLCLCQTALGDRNIHAGCSDSVPQRQWHGRSFPALLLSALASYELTD